MAETVVKHASFIADVNRRVSAMQTIAFRSGYAQALVDVMRGGDPAKLAEPEKINQTAKDFLGDEYFDFSKSEG